MRAETPFIHASWDAEVRMWTAVSDDIPGLAVEAATPNALLDEIRHALNEIACGIEVHAGNVVQVEPNAVVAFRVEGGASPLEVRGADYSITLVNMDDSGARELVRPGGERNH